MNRHVASWCMAIGVCFATLSVTACRPRSHAKTPELSKAQHFMALPRCMKLCLRNNEITVGDSPMMLSAYDETGAAASMLSADFNCTFLDIEGIPENIGPLSPKLGIQFGSKRTQFCAATLNRKKYDRVNIDSYGVAFPRRIGGPFIEQVNDGGPFIAVRLNNGDFSSKRLSVSIETAHGRTLSTRLSGDILVVERVPREPLRIAIKHSGLFGKRTRGVLFPMYRGATDDVVIYNLLSVPF